MKYLTGIAPIIVAFITGIFSNQMKDLILTFKGNKLKKLHNISDSKKIFENSNPDFVKDFVETDITENYFFIRTGIRTNQISIASFINFKKDLKENFDWKSIKKALPYLKFDQKNKIYIKITKKDVFFKNVELVMSLVMFLFGIAGILTIHNFVNTYEFKKIVLVITVFLIPMIFGYLFMSNLSSYFIAKRMKIALKKVTNTISSK